MNRLLALTPFALLTMGTLGLLTNEFILGWGRTTTLLFAVLNLAGRLALSFASWSGRRSRSE